MDYRKWREELNRHIPLSVPLGVEAELLEPDRVRLAAPLAPNNLNYKGTAFGGSLHAVAVLAGWSLVATGLESEGLSADYVVIQDSHLRYAKPIAQDFKAEAEWASAQAKATFFQALRRKGLGRVEVRVTVTCQGELGAELSARFVAQVKTGPGA